MTRFRLIFIGVFFALSFGVVIYRAGRLQLFPHQLVESLARRQLEHKVEIVSRRGNIVDRNGRELAVSINSMSLFANPKLVENPLEVANALAPVLGVPPVQLSQKIKEAKAKKFIWLARQLSQKQMKALERVDLKSLEGVGVLPEYRREFPQKNVGSQYLGFVSVDGVGLEGIERQFQTQLVGERESVTLSKDALGRPMFGHRDQIRMELDKGSDVELTIDSQLQYSVEKVLKEAVDEHHADGGSAIVLDPYSGEILSMASIPNFDSNDPSAAPRDSRRNRIITDPIEPGSVLKPFVVARALEDKLVSTRSMIPTYGGKIKIGRKTINEAEANHRFEQVSIVDLIRLSSNVGAVVLSQRIGWPRVEDTYRRLGFGSLLGMDLAGESKGIFNSPRKGQLLEQATMSFGQGISLTILQIAQAYAVIANGGVRVRPHLLKAIKGATPLDASSETLEAGSERVFSLETTQKMKEILEKVVEGEGTGVLAKVDGFKVAGKTGTSQKVDYKFGGYEKGAYWSQFTGFIPSTNPKYVIAVVIDNPKGKDYYGGVVAAPAFSKIAQAAIRLGRSEAPVAQVAGGINPLPRVAQTGFVGPAPARKLIVQAPSTLSAEKLKLSAQRPKMVAPKNVVFPQVVGLPLANALKVLKERGFVSEILEAGTQVFEQDPAAGTPVLDNHKVVLKLR